MASSPAFENEQANSKGQSPSDAKAQPGDTPLSFAYIGIYPHDTQQSAEKRAAAAAARRRRRKALVRRSRSPKALAAKRRAAAGSPMNPVSTLTTSTGDLLVQGEALATAQSSELSLLQPTVEGVQNIASRLYGKEEIVAIPTECTYEIMVKVEVERNSNGNVNWDILQNPLESLLQHNLHDKRSSSAIETGEITGERSTTVYETRNGTILPSGRTSPEFQKRKSPSSVLDDSDETGFRMNLSPHLYFPSVAALENSAFLKCQLPKKSYAIRIPAGRRSSTDTVGSTGSSGAGKAVLATFNESMVVLGRIAARVWPGPVKLFVAVPEASKLTVTNDKCPGHYMPLRCPCHPLSMKVFHEYQKLEQVDNPSEGKDSPPSTPNGKTNTNVPPGKQCLLFGLPLIKCAQHDTGTNSPAMETGYMTTAKDVMETHGKNDKGIKVKSQQTLNAVLNGEETREIFSVPTCEHGEPWSVSVWVNASSRTITIQGLTRTTEPVSKKLKVRDETYSPDSVATGEEDEQADVANDVFLSSTSFTKSISPDSLLNALQGFKPKTLKERVVKSVMMQWKVVDAHSGKP